VALIFIIIVVIAITIVYLAVGIALVSVWSRADPRLGLSPPSAGFFVLAWPIVAIAIILLVVLYSLGEIVMAVARVGERGGRP
jgi:hypothetical protein